MGVGRVGREESLIEKKYFTMGKNPTLNNHSGHAVQSSVSGKINEKLFIARCTWGKNYYFKKWVKGVWSRIKEGKNHVGCHLFSAPFLSHEYHNVHRILKVSVCCSSNLGLTKPS